MKNEKFEIIAKTFQGLEDVLAEEISILGGENIEIGRRMVSFIGDKELLYKSNLQLRTALRILKPIYQSTANNTDEVYEKIKEFNISLQVRHLLSIRLSIPKNLNILSLLHIVQKMLLLITFPKKQEIDHLYVSIMLISY